MIKLRDYQTRAVENVLAAMRSGKKRVLLTAATGSGKSLCIAELARLMQLKNPNSRMLVLCHRSEILRQNEVTLKSHGVQDIGVYCAKVDGRKERHNKVILASPQSLGRDPTVCGKFAVVIVDECHLLPLDIVEPKDKPSQYAKILNGCGAMWLIGLTGSPYRMDSEVIYGKGKQFEYQADCISTRDLQDQGFLVPHKLPRAPALADVRGVKINKSTNDFDTEEMSKLFGTERVVSQAVDRWWQSASDRKLSLFFCCSLAHAEMVKQSAMRYTSQVEVINGQTETRKRKKMIEDAKDGKYKVLVNVDVLTTGTDIPLIDCVVFLRATQSTSLWIQSVGRGLRLSPGKTDALVLDMAGNWERFSGIDDPMVAQANASVRTDGKGYQIVKDELERLGIEQQDTPGAVKKCGECSAEQPVGVKVCRKCGHVFISHNFTPAEIRQKSLEGWRLYEVNKISFNEDYKTRAGRKCVRATVVCQDLRAFTFYLMVYDESGFTGRKGEHKRWLRFLKTNPPQVFIKQVGAFPELENMTFSLS